MAAISLTVTGLDKAQRLRVPFAEIAKAVLTRDLREARDYARTTYLTGGTTETRLAERTGALKNSFDFEVSSGTTPVTARLGYLNNPPKYVAVHEGWPEGRSSTTIRPRQAQALALPLTDEARRAGSPRNIPGETFIGHSRAGRMFIFRRLGNGQLEALYLLTSQVVIPARPALVPTVQRYAPLIAQDLQQAIAKSLRGEAA